MDAQTAKATPLRTTGKLQLFTPSEQEIVMVRSFNAPRRLVFKALTTPELVQQWLLGTPGWTMPVCEIDLRVGGRYRFVWRGPKGEEMGVKGVYREITPPERIVGTEAFEPAWYPGELAFTQSLVEQGDQTTLTMALQYASREARDIAIKTPMDRGVEQSYERMEQILKSLEDSGGRS
jgi:uncharacterized protein YndB with AHSA1/START domain